MTVIDSPEATLCFDLVPNKYGICFTAFNLLIINYMMSVCAKFSLVLGGITMNIPFKFCLPIPFVSIPVMKAPKQPIK